MFKLLTLNKISPVGMSVFNPEKYTYSADMQEPDGILVHSAPLFWNTEHMFVMVAGRDWGMCYLGGGDHGGPICKKAVLPKEWDALCEKYLGKLPEYVDY